MSQLDLVKTHLKNHGYITQVIASNYGIRRLASRINDLKNKGVNINTTMKTDDLGVRYAYYSVARKRRQ